MNILIVGAGGVGGYYGAVLMKAGVNVSFLVTPRSLPILQSKGLTVKSKGEVWNFSPPVSTNPEDLGPCDLIIIAVKRYDTEKVLDTIQSVVSKDTMILTIQNGIDGEEEILHRFPDANVLGGVAFLASKIEEPGVISHIGAGSLGIGELDGSESERVQSIVNLFKNAGVPTKLSKNILKTKWEKLCWNSVFNPLSVILNGPLDNILDSKDALDVAFRIFEEIRAVAEKKGIIIDAGLMDEQINVTQKLRGYHTSMFEDFSKGKPTEIDYFNGYVCREGVRSNVATPVNYTVTSLVKAIIFRHKTAG